MWRMDFDEFRKVAAEFDKLPDIAKRHAGDYVHDWAEDLKAGLVAESPRGPDRQGQPHMADSYRSVGNTVPGKAASAEVFNEAAHHPFVLEPTRPHVIKPRRATYLSWESSGRRHFAREVHHPGTKGNPAHDRAWESMQGGLNESLSALAEKIFGKAIGKSLS